MKKTIALILAVLLLCSGLLVGCSGNSSGDANSSPSATATESAGTPTESAEQVERDFDTFGKRSFQNLLSELLPQKMIRPFVDLTGIDPFKPIRSDKFPHKGAKKNCIME